MNNILLFLVIINFSAQKTLGNLSALNKMIHYLYWQKNADVPPSYDKLFHMEQEEYLENRHTRILLQGLQFYDKCNNRLVLLYSNLKYKLLLR